MSAFNRTYAEVHARAWPEALRPLPSGPVAKAVTIAVLCEIEEDWPLAAFNSPTRRRHVGAEHRDHLVPLRNPRHAAPA